MAKDDRTYVIIRIDENNFIEVIQIGEYEYCAAKMFEILTIKSKMMEELDCDHGRHFKVKQLKEGKEVEIHYILQSYYEEEY